MRTLGLAVTLSYLILSSATSHAQGMGLKFLSKETYATIPLAAPPTRGALPPSFDLSADFPEPGWQGQQGSCVAWAVAYGLKSYQERVERGWKLDDPNHLFSPAALYNGIKLNSPCSPGGSYIVDAFEALTSWGALSLADFPYDELDCSRLPTVADKATGNQFRISSTRTVNVSVASEVKSNIASGFPVVIGMLLHESFKGYKTGLYTPAGPELGGHAVIVVGYDDSRSAYKVMNSWGTKWGQKGFFWIDYNTFRDVVREAYVSQDIVIRPDVNLPTIRATGDATIRDGFRWYGQGQFSFDEKSIVAWDSNRGDIGVGTRPGDVTTSFFLPFDAPPYAGSQDNLAQSGIQDVSNATYSSVTACPLTGYLYHWKEIKVDSVYCVRSRDAGKFYKIHVLSADSDKVNFEWQRIN